MLCYTSQPLKAIKVQVCSLKQKLFLMEVPYKHYGKMLKLKFYLSGQGWHKIPNCKA